MKIYLFTYGTLMNGECRNYALKYTWKRLGEDSVIGYKLYHFTEGDYPVVFRTDNLRDRIMGECWEFEGSPDFVRKMLSFLDDIEGAPGLYYRMTVTLNSGVEAVMYCGNKSYWEGLMKCLQEWSSGVKWHSWG